MYLKISILLLQAVMAELEAPLRHAITSVVMAELKAPLCNLKIMTSLLSALQFNPTSSHVSSIKNKEYRKKAWGISDRGGCRAYALYGYANSMWAVPPKIYQSGKYISKAVAIYVFKWNMHSKFHIVRNIIFIFKIFLKWNCMINHQAKQSWIKNSV